MPIRFPLLAKILLWFFLNLLVLAAVGYGLFRMQFRLGLDSLLAGRAGERVQALSEVINAELRAKPVRLWDESLENYSRAYQADFLLFRSDGTQVAGQSTTLPAPVRAKLAERRGAGEGFGRGPPPGRGPRRDLETAHTQPLARFFVHTRDPAGYWVGVCLPLTESAQGRMWPLTLMVRSDSLSLGGLLFDVTPWLVAGLGAVLFSVLFWLPLVRGLTRSLSRMTQATEQIAEGRFETRVNERRRDELGRLGLAINRMAARLAGFVTGQKRFLGDIAHELRSPLARMQMALGILEERADAGQKTYVADVREEVEEMSGLVDELLTFSRAGLQQRKARREPVPVAALLAEVVAREAAEPGQVETTAADALAALAEPELLRRALGNVLRNAVRYAGHAGPIRLAAVLRGREVVITVADQGPGVPAESLAQIFDPFYRGEASRSRESGGAGLGLAIVKTCIEACQGRVSARNLSPAGLEVEIILPAAPLVPPPSSGGDEAT